MVASQVNFTIMRRIAIRFALVVLLPVTVLSVAIGCSKHEGVRGDSAELSAFAQQMLSEVNRVRTQPKEYAEVELKPLIKKGDQSKFQVALQGCYKALLTTEARKPLALHDALMLSAQWFADDYVKTKKIGHIGSDGSDVSGRVKRYTKVFGSYVGENCQYGLTEARAVVRSLVIDVDDDARRHRGNILHDKYTHMGVGFLKTKDVPYGSVVVQDFGWKHF